MHKYRSKKTAYWNPTNLESLKTITTVELRKNYDAYVDFRCSTGVKFQANSKILDYFIRFCELHYADSNLPDDVVNLWLSCNPNQKNKTKCSKVSAVKLFAQYLFSLGFAPLRIPYVHFSRATAFIPHIFTNEEIDRIWQTVDNLRQEKQFSNAHRCLPVLFRLLYSCGLRISEALAIELKDIDFEAKVITIRHAKNDTERLVPFLDSLNEVLKRYAIECTSDLQSDSPFFYYRKGERISSLTVYSRFRRILLLSNIPYKGKDRGPRLHDFRHTFAVKAMNKLADENKDLYIVLPILAALLGHESVATTEKYIRLTEDRFSNITDNVASIMPRFFPEVKENGEI